MTSPKTPTPPKPSLPEPSITHPSILELPPSLSLANRSYRKHWTLKYGCNPHQQPAAFYELHHDSPDGAAPGSIASGGASPLQVLNGNPGYINLLDALNAWQLVRELRSVLGLTAAASFKHLSPAGAALGLPLSDTLRAIYDDANLTKDSPSRDNATKESPAALAYLRARQADPLSSFGDMVALSDTVDLPTARLLERQVSDGIIAPAYHPEARALLAKKKRGNYLILQMDANYQPPPMTYRQIFGFILAQPENPRQPSLDDLQRVVTNERSLSPAAKRDLLLAAITVKYTQSNAVGLALDGQMLGIGAGQQNRVDCTRLAVNKAQRWFLRQHPAVRALPFRDDVPRVARTNARLRYIDGHWTPAELRQWTSLLQRPQPPLEAEQKQAFLRQLRGVSLASDAFFPFRDSIDVAARGGVEYIVQPGGSIADEEIIAACDEHQIAMTLSGLRLFHH